MTDHRTRIIKINQVIRFRTGDYALMRVVRYDDLCGYRTYHGQHLFGEPISVADTHCRPATPEERKVWDSYRPDRHAYAYSEGEAA